MLTSSKSFPFSLLVPGRGEKPPVTASPILPPRHSSTEETPRLPPSPSLPPRPSQEAPPQLVPRGEKSSHKAPPELPNRSTPPLEKKQPPAPPETVPITQAEVKESKPEVVSSEKKGGPASQQEVNGAPGVGAKPLSGEKFDYARVYVALYNCVADDEDDLAFERGNQLYIREKIPNSDWWVASLMDRPDVPVGLVPRNYLMAAYSL